MHHTGQPHPAPCGSNRAEALTAVCCLPPRRWMGPPTGHYWPLPIVAQTIIDRCQTHSVQRDGGCGRMHAALG